MADKPTTAEASQRWQPQLGMKDPLPTLINLAREAFMEQVRPLLRKYDLTDQQWRTMKALYMLGDLDAAELAENASLRKPSLSRVIRQLGDRKLLTPVRDKNDRRRVISRLTKKGETICLELGPNMELNHNEAVTLLGDVNLDLLRRELNKMIYLLQEKAKADATAVAGKSAARTRKPDDQI